MNRKLKFMNRFSLIPSVDHPRSSFDLSYNHKTTFDAGLLVPICVQEVLPGDTFTINQSSLIRFASALVTPLMDNLELKTEYFFVPNRLVWQNWERMMGQQDNPEDSIDYLVPSVSLAPASFASISGTFFDYVGVPVLPSSSLTSSTTSVNILPLRAYWKVYNDWYRDENLCDSSLKYFRSLFTTDSSLLSMCDSIYGTSDCAVSSASVSSVNLSKLFGLARRAKRHDYFTSALPWPQKGPGVELPLGGTVPILSTGSYIPVGSYTHPSSTTVSTSASDHVYTGTGVVYGSSDPILYGKGTYNGSNVSIGLTFGSEGSVFPSLEADLSQATAITINSLRQAFQLQKFYELSARGGTRYTEIIRSFFGVISPDARLQRSEYLGGFSAPIQIESVPQTSGTNSTSPQANLAAFGLSSSVNRAFSKSFTEHGFILGLASVLSKPSYQQGLNRMYSRKGRFDYYWQTFAHLGEQAILNKEIYLQGTAADDEVFGYQERYAEYRFNTDMITGQMRSNNSLSLDSWHLSQHFSNLPTLNSDFIEEKPPIDRVVAVGSGTGANQFIGDFYFDIKAVRVMPVYGVPGLVDHF